MKQVIICGGCDRPVRRYGSFTAKLTEKIKGTDVDLPPRVIKLCRKCADYAGYKVKGI